MPAITRAVQLPATDEYRPLDIGEALSDLDRRLLSGELRHDRPIPLGLPAIDACLGGGAQLDDLILLGGPSNVGKTTLALQVAAHAARADPDTLAIYICYEHTRQLLLQRLLCLESVDDDNLEHPTGLTRDALAACIADHYAREARERDLPALDVQTLFERLPLADRARLRLETYLDRLWLIKGDGLYTTDDKLGQYLDLARAYGWRRILLVVDYAQRVPIRADLAHLNLSESQRIDFIMRACKGFAMKYHIPIIGVAAADEEGIRKTRVHFENLWGGSLVQYEPDVALILNRDSVGAGSTVRRIRIAIEKNRHGPSEVEFRHWLHGAHYCVSTRGEAILEGESYQRDRVAGEDGGRGEE